MKVAGNVQIPLKPTLQDIKVKIIHDAISQQIHITYVTQPCLL